MYLRTIISLERETKEGNPFRYLLAVRVAPYPYKRAKYYIGTNSLERLSHVY